MTPNRLPPGQYPPKPGQAAVPRGAFSIGEACEYLGVSRDFWNEHLADKVPTSRIGRRRLVRRVHLDRLLEQQEEAVAETLRRGNGSPAARESPANEGARPSRAAVRDG